MRSLFLALAASLPIAGVAQAQAQAQSPRRPAPFDQLFLRNEASGTAYERAIAQLAQTRATREDVRTYAAKLVADHEAYNAALRELAKIKRIALPAGLTARSSATRDSLARLQGASFDRAFIREARRINEEDVRSFRQEAARTTDPDISAFVTQFLAVDEGHAKDAAVLAASPGPAVAATPVIRPPSGGSNMPVIRPPSGDSAMPVIPPPSSAK